MKKVNYEINVETGDATKNIDKTNESVQDLNKNLEETDDNLKEVNSEGKKTSFFKKGFEGAKQGAKKFSGGIKAMGVAIKAAGIGLLLSGLALLKELLMSNQKVVDGFSTAFETVAIVFGEFANAIETVYNNVSQTTENFDALGKVLNGLLTLSFTPIKLAFQGIRAAIVGAQLAWEQSFFGGNDEKKIEELKLQLSEIKDNVVEIGKDAIGAGKDIVNNFGEAISEAGEIGSQVIEEVSKINLKASFETAKTNVELRKQAELAAVANAGLIEKYDRQAEQQRQIRDDVRKSISERRAANEELNKILDKQQKKMLENAQISLRSAQAEIKKDKHNMEAKKALMEAENELAAVQATITGLRSEQKTNEAALDIEALEMIKSRLESESALHFEKQKFDAEQKESDLERLTLLKKIHDEELKTEGDRLQNNINAVKAGTQAKVDAEIAYNEFLERMRQEQFLLDKELEAAKLASNENIRKDNEKTRLEEIDNINKLLDLATQAANATQAIGDAVFAHKMNNLEKGSKEEEEMAKKQFKFNKALQLGMAVIDGAKAITSSLSQSPVAIGPVPNPAGIASLAFAITTSAAQIATIAAQKFQPSLSSATSPSASSPSGVSESQAPQFNVVGDSAFNQIAGALGQPIQAYVVAQDVTTAQQLDNGIITSATLGGG